MAITRQAPKLPARFVLPGSNPGLVVRGNIDINHRKIVQFRGKGATVFSVSFGVERKGRILHVLVPRVINGAVRSEDYAWRYYLRTKQHLGMFNTPENATAYANRLHLYHMKIYG